MNTVIEFLKGVVTVVGGTILVTLGGAVVILPFVMVMDAIKDRGRPRGPSGLSDFARIRGRMKRAAQPTLLLTPAREPGFSKLGGDPELPLGVAWPDDGGRQRDFVAQIDLAAFRQHGGPDWLPTSGRVYVFVDETRYVFADLIRVLASDEPAGPAVAPPAPAVAFPERRVAFETYTSLPSLDWLSVDLAQVNLTGQELDEMAEEPTKAFGDELPHRIGGFPAEIQDERMPVACELLRRGLPPEHEGTEVTDAILRAARQWRLLLQIDSDPALKMNWGDGGRLYVFIREKDALKGDFSQTVTISQSH